MYFSQSGTTHRPERKPHCNINIESNRNDDNNNDNDNNSHTIHHESLSIPLLLLEEQLATPEREREQQQQQHEQQPSDHVRYYQPQLSYSLRILYAANGLILALPMTAFMYVVNTRVAMPVADLSLYAAVAFVPFSWKPIYATLSSSSSSSSYWSISSSSSISSISSISLCHANNRRNNTITVNSQNNNNNSRTFLLPLLLLAHSVTLILTAAIPSSKSSSSTSSSSSSPFASSAITACLIMALLRGITSAWPEFLLGLLLLEHASQLQRQRKQQQHEQGGRRNLDATDINPILSWFQSQAATARNVGSLVAHIAVMILLTIRHQSWNDQLVTVILFTTASLNAVAALVAWRMILTTTTGTATNDATKSNSVDNQIIHNDNNNNNNDNYLGLNPTRSDDTEVFAITASHSNSRPEVMRCNCCHHHQQEQQQQSWRRIVPLILLQTSLLLVAFRQPLWHITMQCWTCIIRLWGKISSSSWSSSSSSSSLIVMVLLCLVVVLFIVLHMLKCRLKGTRLVAIQQQESLFLSHRLAANCLVGGDSSICANSESRRLSYCCCQRNGEFKEEEEVVEEEGDHPELRISSQHPWRVALFLIIRHALPNASYLMDSYLYSILQPRFPVLFQSLSVLCMTITSLASWSFAPIWAVTHPTNAGDDAAATPCTAPGYHRPWVVLMATTGLAAISFELNQLLLNKTDNNNNNNDGSPTDNSLSVRFIISLVIVSVITTWMDEWKFLPDVILATSSAVTVVYDEASSARHCHQPNATTISPYSIPLQTERNTKNNNVTAASESAYWTDSIDDPFAPLPLHHHHHHYHQVPLSTKGVSQYDAMHTRLLADDLKIGTMSHVVVVVDRAVPSTGLDDNVNNKVEDEEEGNDMMMHNNNNNGSCRCHSRFNNNSNDDDDDDAGLVYSIMLSSMDLGDQIGAMLLTGLVSWFGTSRDNHWIHLDWLIHLTSLGMILSMLLGYILLPCD